MVILPLTSGAICRHRDRVVRVPLFDWLPELESRSRTQQNPEAAEMLDSTPPKGQFVYVAGETKISTFDGPAYEGENYTICRR